MKSENIVMVIDAGNTSIKAGCFVNDKLKEVKRFSFNFLSKLVNWQQKSGAKHAILSSVLNKKDTETIVSALQNCKIVDKKIDSPLPIQYKSFDTLGMDRLCNAAYCFSQMKSEFAVVIDIGTCIKFDLVHKKKGYIGGSISPGIDLRYKSLNDYTGNLPLLSNKTMDQIVGYDTETSIFAGVLNGTHAEISGIMAQYEKQYCDLTFFMTGGDASNFEIHSKNDIFADENLTIKGLYEIYKQNA